MTLSDIKAHCEKDEARMDGAHAKMDKLTDEKSGSSSSKDSFSIEGTGTPSGKIVAVVVVTIVAIAATVGYLLFMSGGSENDSSNNPPVIVDAVFVNGANGMRVWVNASDIDNAISTITIAVYANVSPLGNSVFQKVYWVNQSTANITGVILLSNLPAGNYLITTYATDMLGKESASSAFQSFTLPA